MRKTSQVRFERLAKRRDLTPTPLDWEESYFHLEVSPLEGIRERITDVRGKHDLFVFFLVTGAKG
jgi:hypothetical protein